MEEVKDQVLGYVLAVIAGDLVAFGTTILALGGFSNLVTVLINVSMMDYLFLGLKTFVLAAIGALGGLLTKWIWNKIRQMKTKN